jgi:enamine deaminase RidA (YjgF/YER057c/UK114 family)
MTPLAPFLRLALPALLLLNLSSCVGIISRRDVAPEGHAQSVRIQSENYRTIYVSGQFPLNDRGELVGADDLEKQTAQVFLNIEQQLEGQVGGLSNLVSITCYLTDASQIDAFRRGRDRMLDPEAPPSSTVVVVDELPVEGAMVMVSAVAVVSFI